MSVHTKAMMRLCVAVTSILAIFAGCAEHEPLAFRVNGNRVVNQESNCELKEGGGQKQFRPFGYLDLSVSNSYLVFPAFGSGLPESESIHGDGPAQLMLNNNVIIVKGARVSYDLPPDFLGFDADQFLQFNSFQNQFLFSSGSVESGSEGLSAIEAIPPTVGNLFANADALQERYSSAQIIARLTFEGELLDGTKVFSNEFAYPITLCNGCLIYFPVTNCTNLDPEPAIEFPCFPGQDDGLDCRACYVLANSEEDALKCLPPEVVP